MTATFHEIFESMLNVHAPLRKRKVRTEYASWINLSIKEFMRQRDQTKILVTKDIALRPKYKKLCNLVTYRIREAVKEYYSQKISDNQGNPSKKWKTINTVLGKTSKTTAVTMVEFESKQLTDKKKLRLFLIGTLPVSALYSLVILKVNSMMTQPALSPAMKSLLSLNLSPLLSSMYLLQSGD